MKKAILLSMFFIMFCHVSFAADTNTVTSTITGTNTITGTTTVDKTPPTANAPNVIINNNDVCRSGYSAGLQSSVVGLSTGVTVEDKNCERIKLSRSLYAMGMKVAAVSALCQDARVFDAMMMAGTPCPYYGAIGDDARESWKKNTKDIPEGSLILPKIIKEQREEELLQEEINDLENTNKTDKKVFSIGKDGKVSQ